MANIFYFAFNMNLHTKLSRKRREYIANLCIWFLYLYTNITPVSQFFIKTCLWVKECIANIYHKFTYGCNHRILWISVNDPFSTFLDVTLCSSGRVYVSVHGNVNKTILPVFIFPEEIVESNRKYSRKEASDHIYTHTHTLTQHSEDECVCPRCVCRV